MFDFDVERNILGGILLDNTKYDDVCKIIDVDDFTKTIHQEIYREIKKNLDAGTQVNIQTLTRLPAFKRQISDVISLTTDAVAVNALYFAKKLKELSNKRVMLKLSEQLQIFCKDTETDSAGIVEDIEAALNLIVLNKNSNIYKPLKDFMQLAIKKIEVDCNAHGIPGTRTGFGYLDLMIGGLMKQELIVLGARPSIGKTALALNIAEQVSKAGKAVGFFSLEMSGTSLVQRMLCGNCDIGQDQIRRGSLTPAQFRELADTVKRLFDYPLFIYDYPNADLSDLKAKARLLRRTEKIELLVIDYLGLIRVEGSKMPRWEKVGIISADLKALARELDIPILVLSQLGRQAEEKEPTLADLRDSGSIEQDADIVMFLHRKREMPETELHIAKNRNGNVGKVKMIFQAKSTRFREIDDQKKEWPECQK